MLNRLAGLVVSTLWMTLASTCRTGVSNDKGMMRGRLLVGSEQTHKWQKCEWWRLTSRKRPRKSSLWLRIWSGFCFCCLLVVVKLDSRLLSAVAILEWLWNQDLLCTESGPKLRWLRSKCRMTIEIRYGIGILSWRLLLSTGSGTGCPKCKSLRLEVPAFFDFVAGSGGSVLSATEGTVVRVLAQEFASMQSRSSSSFMIFYSLKCLAWS